MSAPTELKGPDLAAGIPEGDLADGAMMEGHAHGESVLLARQGDEVFAVGAYCTHYGAPLADGLLVDDTVRCPFHHACFSLRTGHAVRAPALNPVTRFDVEQGGGRLRVLGKSTESDTVPGLAPPHPRSIVILGGGAAGQAAAEPCSTRATAASSRC
jgi:nitrite reductase/ring-hydroxylating ferredoxin subunit